MRVTRSAGRPAAFIKADDLRVREPEVSRFGEFHGVTEGGDRKGVAVGKDGAQTAKRRG